MKIFDCMTYINELEILKYRIDSNYNLVHHFVIIQASTTHRASIKIKKLNLDEIKDPDNKIIYCFIDLPKNLNPKEREHFQRDYINNILKKKCHQNDFCIISDLDEVPNYAVLLRYLKTFNLLNKICHHINITFVYNINYIQSNYWHAASFSAPFFLIKNKSLSQIRFNPDKYLKGVLTKKYRSFTFNQPKIYSYNGCYCFYHLNRFHTPLKLYLKEVCSFEGSGNYSKINIDIVKKNLKRIVDGSWDNIKYDENKILRTRLEKYLNPINIMNKKELNHLWSKISKLSDDEFINWYNNFFTDNINV